MSTLAATEPLTWFTLRRDRLRIVVWIAAIVIGMYLSAASTKGVFPTQADLDAAKAVSIDNPAAIAFNGPPIALDTMGGQIAFQVGAFGLTLVGLMAVLMTGRLTRGEEDSGRLEMVRSMPVGRHGPMASAVVVVSAMSVVVGVLVALSMPVLDLPVMGSLVFGASFTSLGLVFVGITLVAAQITENPRVVAGLGGAVLGASYVVRAIGDIGGGALSWLSPIGIAQKSEPYAGDRWWPLLVNVALAALLTWAAAEFAFTGTTSVAGWCSLALVVRARQRSWAHQKDSLCACSEALCSGGPSRCSRSASPTGPSRTASRASSRTTSRLLTFSPGRAARASSTRISRRRCWCSLWSRSLALCKSHCDFGPRRRRRGPRRSSPPVPPGSRWAGSHILLALVGGLVVLAAGGLGTGITYALVGGDGGQVLRLLGAALGPRPRCG